MFILRTIQADHFLSDQWVEVSHSYTFKERMDAMLSPTFYVEENMIAQFGGTGEKFIYRRGEWHSLDKEMPYHALRELVFESLSYDRWIYEWKCLSSLDSMVILAKTTLPKKIVLDALEKCFDLFSYPFVQCSSIEARKTLLLKLCSSNIKNRKTQKECCDVLRSSIPMNDVLSHLCTF